jgi:hypothetical protein
MPRDTQANWSRVEESLLIVDEIVGVITRSITLNRTGGLVKGEGFILGKADTNGHPWPRHAFGRLPARGDRALFHAGHIRIPCAVTQEWLALT